MVGIAIPVLSAYTKFGAKYASNLLGLGLALILPPAYGITLFLGAAIATLRLKRKPDASEYILIIASGLIIGESFVEMRTSPSPPFSLVRQMQRIPDEPDAAVTEWPPAAFTEPLLRSEIRTASPGNRIPSRSPS
jgi:OPT oligopeptide transporter protein